MSATDHEPETEDLEVLLSVHDQLRQEIRAHGKRKSRRYLASLTILGVVIGYIFTSTGDARILSLVPFVLVFLYSSHISSMNYVVQLAALLAVIEVKLNHLGAEYEFYHGGFNISYNPRFKNVKGSPHNPTHLQETVQTRVRRLMDLLAIGTYFVACIIGFLSISQNGFPEYGLESLTLSIAIGATILFTQLVLFYEVARAWKAYDDHKEHLKMGVKQTVEEKNLIGGVRTLEALDDG